MRERRYEAYATFNEAAEEFLNRDIVVRAKGSGELPIEMMRNLKAATSRIYLLGPDSVYAPAYTFFELIMSRGASRKAMADVEYNALVQAARRSFTTAVREAMDLTREGEPVSSTLL